MIRPFSCSFVDVRPFFLGRFEFERSFSFPFCSPFELALLRCVLICLLSLSKEWPSPFSFFFSPRVQLEDTRNHSPIGRRKGPSSPFISGVTYTLFRGIQTVPPFLFSGARARNYASLRRPLLTGDFFLSTIIDTPGHVFFLFSLSVWPSRFFLPSCLSTTFFFLLDRFASRSFDRFRMSGFRFPLLRAWSHPFSRPRRFTPSFSSSTNLFFFFEETAGAPFFFSFLSRQL